METPRLGTEERRKLLRARLRILTVLVVDAGVVTIGILSGLAWHDWVLLVVTMLLTLAAWVTVGLRDGGWTKAALATWLLNVGCIVAMGVTAGDGFLALVTGLLYGTIWTAFIVVPVAIVSTIVREVT